MSEIDRMMQSLKADDLIVRCLAAKTEVVEAARVALCRCQAGVRAPAIGRFGDLGNGERCRGIRLVLLVRRWLGAARVVLVHGHCFGAALGFLISGSTRATLRTCCRCRRADDDRQQRSSRKRGNDTPCQP